MEKEDLIRGAIYEVSAIGFNVAIWTGEAFKGPAKAFGKVYFAEEKPYWEGLPFGTSRPIKRIGELTINKPFDGSNLLAVMNALDEAITLEEERKINETSNIR